MAITILGNCVYRRVEIMSDTEWKNKRLMKNEKVVNKDRLDEPENR
jgi:hypothetical protein